MRKITEISPRRLARLSQGYTRTTNEAGWTVVTADSTGREVFASSNTEWADYVIETITGQPAAA